ncbi:MAG: hypothetical protein LBU79_00820 [Planctomycetota bacterium]|jgi:hypothetical protein|nr:hypothetical protein [Planctomycetota bacterium]
MRKLSLVMAVFFLATVVWGGEEPAIAIPLRLPKAKVGEWVTYKMSDGGERREKVVNIRPAGGDGNDSMITLRRESLVDGIRVDQQDVTFSLADILKETENMDLVASGTTLSWGKADFRGAEIDVVVLSSQIEGLGTSKSLMSDKVPVTGLLRIELDGKPFLELVDSGDGE